MEAFSYKTLGNHK